MTIFLWVVGIVIVLLAGAAVLFSIMDFHARDAEPRAAGKLSSPAAK